MTNVLASALKELAFHFGGFDMNTDKCGSKEHGIEAKERSGQSALENLKWEILVLISNACIHPSTCP